MSPIRRKTGRGIGVVLLAAALMLRTAPAAGALAGETGEAADLTKPSVITAGNGSTAKLQDGSYATAWKADPGARTAVTILLPEGESPGGLYLSWSVRPDAWRVQLSSDGERWTDCYIGSAEGPRDQYVTLEDAAERTLDPPLAPEGCEGTRDRLCRYLRVVMDSGETAAGLYELRALGAGTVPGGVERWSAPAQDAQLMVISAHPDDETVFFSGVLPTYAGEQRRETVVVYMAVGARYREVEALGALWASGVESYPVFGPFEDFYCETLEACARGWGKETALAFVVEQIRRFRPEVVVSHDVNGEYGHGAHMLTAWAVQEAMTAAADPARFPESAERYGVWQVKKCYLHLYSENRIVMDWTVPLARFGGQTAYEVAEEALLHHASQLHWKVVRVHTGTDTYPCTRYGLYFTTVGPDVKGGDFFENIGEQAAGE